MKRRAAKEQGMAGEVNEGAFGGPFIFRQNEFRRRSMKMHLLGRVAGTIVLLLCVGAASAQEASVPNASQAAAQEAPKDAVPMALTLKRAIQMALQNSKEIQVAKIQASVADRA